MHHHDGHWHACGVWPYDMHQGAPGDGQRCFTTYVPEAVKNAEAGLQVPLVVDMHGGLVTVHSRPGEGSQFEIWFPDA